MNMKAIRLRYILAAAVTLLLVMPASAQTDEEATIKAMRRVIGRHPSYAVEEFIEKEIAPKFKKSPNVMVGIARHFNDANDSTNAFKYTNRALMMDNKYVPAYVMMGKIKGDWAHTHEDSLEAFAWYQRAIDANPKDSEGYLAYANVLAKKDPEAAISKLSEILNHNPDYDVNLYAGKLYLDKADGPNSYKYFIKADTSKMTAGDLTGYVTVLRVQHDYGRADTVLNTAQSKFPKHAALNRLRLKNDIDIKDYEHALIAAETLFNGSDSLEVDLEDYIYHGKAYVGLKRYEEAIETFQKGIDYEIVREHYHSDATFENAKKQEGKFKGQAMQEIAKSYDEMGYPDEAIEMQKKYIGYKKEQGELDVYDVVNLANFYKAQYESEMGEAKLTALKNWYDTYEVVAEVSPENADFAYGTRFDIAIRILDKEEDGGHGVADAEKLIEIIPLTDDISSRNKKRLELALEYLAAYYFMKDQYAESGKYFKMLRDVNPDNARLKAATENKGFRKKLGL